MLTRATGLFSIYRGTTTNDSGDLVEDNATPVATNVVLALHNVTVVEDNPNTALARVITAIRGRATRGTDLRVMDRIQDRAGIDPAAAWTPGAEWVNGAAWGYEQGVEPWYVVDTVTPPLSSTRNSDLSFSCHRVN